MRAGDADVSRDFDELYGLAEPTLLGGFMIMAFNASCCILAYNADGGMNILLAASVDFDRGSGIEDDEYLLADVDVLVAALLPTPYNASRSCDALSRLLCE